MPETTQESLADAFWAVARELRHRTSVVLAPFGVTPGQARALGHLARFEEGIRLSALSERLRIAPRSGTEVVDALEQRGLVARSPDPDDRRATLVALTPAGRNLADAVRVARSAEGDAFFTALGDADREHLARLLTTLRSPRI